MALASIKLIKGAPKPEAIFQDIQREIGKQLQAVGRQHVTERKKVVDDFETNIIFGYRIKISQSQVSLEVDLTNGSEQVSEGFSVADLWKALDETGVKPHTITPKRPGGVLAFQANYSPHTRPIGRSGGPGQARGPTVFTKKVRHPGFPPRKFSDRINKRLERSFQQAVDRGVRIAGNKKR